MADSGRQSFTDKMGASAKPDSQKSMTEQLSDTAKGAYDSMASSMQPESEKSYTQKAGDAMSGNSNESSQSMSDKAKNATGMNN
ncbi:hypothetical protein DICSQDRAFT_166560 [Dichomitus squalens LYAD-421 SS1]|uniref:Heat shock protein 9/12-domain-containing protein n=1 Tax=Dichomitus squalens TaxID=114155 RepID=A0A4Q9Q2W8_9APHY|nr:uncharacterized protein DICSQDRAFT_166560 [Dichomitus squalens LYAD-421 SS1]EJF65551.1 hypothetical protein DICSQDRAFT_166560 [Dichomitus squalens LYAD-421 SS1]TBU24532.1 heat shock protein 9/12-domain-containing protein [Dichomitus squalens]TBU61603.1 heat shock protein 9/12-domain-containing protein [Dichomitus squalens]